VARPTFTGTARVGSVLTASTPAWSPVARFSYQWYADGRAVKGATGPSHRLSAAERGATVRVVVTGTRTGFTSRSLASVRVTAPVAAAPR
jgi:hypothetical protein